MAAEHVRFNKALTTWDERIVSGDLSVPERYGNTAILLPDYPLTSGEDTLESYSVLRREALGIYAGLRAVGKEVVFADRADTTDFQRVFTDPLISSVVIVGRGSFSSLRVPLHTKTSLDWEHIASIADHLKDRLVQRFCGYYVRRLNVPMGLFAVSNHQYVYAPKGMSFMPVDLNDPQNALIMPVTNKSRLTYQNIKDLFPARG